MDDRTLLHLVLAITLVTLVVNGYTLTEILARTPQGPSEGPPANTAEFPRMTSLEPEARFCIRNARGDTYTVRDNRRYSRKFNIEPHTTHCYIGESDDVLSLYAPEDCPGRGYNFIYHMWPQDSLCYKITGLCSISTSADIAGHCFVHYTTSAGKV